MPLSQKNLRINKYLAKWGGVSRRQADRLVSRGDVTVNGARVTVLGTMVDVKNDKVKVRNKLIIVKSIPFVYLMLHKPENVLTTKSDAKGRPIVMDYLKRVRQNVFSIGRLDWASEGLLLLTNDGDFSQSVSHPKNKIYKTYLVKVRGNPDYRDLNRMLRGVSTPQGKLRAAYVKKQDSSSRNAWVKVIISEGKNRQVRLMFQKIDLLVSRLKRVSIGRLNLSRLPKGKFIRLDERDIKKVFLKPKELS